MAALFRLRRMLTFTNPSSSLSLLHHRHLSSTSGTGAGADPSFNSNPNPSLLYTPSSSSSMPFLLRQTTTHTVKTPALLRHRHLLRPFSTSNSGGVDDPNSNRPSPTLLSELRVAIKQLSSSLNNRDPASSTFPFIPSFNSKQEDAEQNVPAIDNKLEELKVSVLSLRHKQHTDKQRIHEMDQARIAFSDKVYGDLAKLDQHSQDEETHDEMVSTLTVELTWLRDRTMEVVELSQVLVNSRLEALYEIAENLSKLREDLQDDEVWKELDEWLMKVQEMEMKEFEMLAEKFGELIGSMIQQTNDLGCRKHR